MLPRQNTLTPHKIPAFPPDGRKSAGAPPADADSNIVWRLNVS